MLCFHHLLISVSLDMAQPSDLCRYICLNINLSHGYSTLPSFPNAVNKASTLENKKCHVEIISNILIRKSSQILFIHLLIWLKEKKFKNSALSEKV